MSADGEEALWNSVLEGFDQERRHQAFLAYCRETGALPNAARRYREVQEDEDATEERRATADKQLKAITVMALAQFQSTPRTDPASAKKILRLVAALLLAGSILVLGWALAFR